MSTNPQKGFTLIELLVSVMIMAVGILGVASMQVVSLQQNRGALNRAEATQLANDLMDRLRVNTDVTYSALIDADPTNAQSCQTNSCTPVEMAAYDIAQWKCAINSRDATGTTYTGCTNYGYSDDAGSVRGVKGSLPQGAGSVGIVSGLYEIRVEWSSDKIDVPCATRAGTTAEPNCTFIVLRAQVM